MSGYDEFLSELAGKGDEMQIRLSIWCTVLDRLAGVDRGVWWEHVDEPVDCGEVEFEGGLFDLENRESLLRAARLVESATSVARSEGLVLDPCCGDGRWLAALATVAQHADWLDRTWLLDPDPRRLALARMRLTAVADRTDPTKFFVGLEERALCVDALDVGTGVQRGLFDGDDLDDDAPAVVIPRGFDVVVTNPRRFSLTLERRESLRERFASARSIFPYRIVLSERAFDLARPGGLVSVVLPSSLFRREYGRALVGEVLERFKVRDIIYLEEADVPDQLCLSCEKSPAGMTAARIHRVESGKTGDDVVEVLEGSVVESSRAVRRVGDAIDAALMDRETRRVVRTVGEQDCVRLETMLVTSAGRTSSPGLLSLWLADQTVEDPLVLPLVTAENIQPFRIVEPRTIYWPYERPGRPWTPLPEQLEHRLWPYKTPLRERTVFGRKACEVGYWYEHVEHYPARLEGPRIVVKAYGHEIAASMVPDGFAVSSSGIVLNFEDHEAAYAVLAVLNSSFGYFWLRTHGFISENGSVELSVGAIHGVPIPHDGRAELARLARKLERASRSLGPPQPVRTSWSKLEDSFAREREVETELLEKVGELTRELDRAVYRAFEFMDESISEFDDLFYEQHPEVEHLESLRNERQSPTPISLVDYESRFALDWVQKYAAETSLVDLALLAEREGIDLEWLLERLMPHAVEWNPLRVLDSNGLEILSRREKIRLEARRADESEGSYPRDWPLLESHHFSGRALPTMTEAQTDAHHWRHFSAQFRGSTSFFYLGDLSELVESPVFTRMTHDPAAHLEIARAAIDHSTRMAFYPPGPATVEDPRMLGLIGGLFYDRQAIRRASSGDRLEALFRSQIAEGAAFSELVDSYGAWLDDGSRSLESAAADAQLDLAKLVELESFFAKRGEATLREAALRFVSEGWTFSQTRSVLEALAASGRVEAVSENHWRVRES